MPEPVYPTGALFAKVEGKVDVRVVVNEKGEVTSTRVISGHPLLTDAAEQAALRARFSPTKLSDEPVQVMGVLSYNFKENPSASVPAVSPSTTSAKMSTRPADFVPEPAANTATVAPTGAAGNNLPAVSEYARTGMTYLDSGRYKEAVKIFKEGIRTDPENYELYYRLGAAYRSLKHPNEAAESFKKAVRIKPDAADAHYYLGMSYFDLRRYRDSVKAFQNATHLKQGIAEYHFGLGLAHLSANETSSAEGQIKILKNLSPNMAGTLTQAIRSVLAKQRTTGGLLDRKF
jgi:TonB family protein